MATRWPICARTRRIEPQELIEDFMIAANGVTARYLERQRLSFAATGAALARALGADRRARQRLWASACPSEPDAGALERFLWQAPPGRSRALSRLSLSVVKLLGRGEYMLELPGRPAEGHFGLAVNDYTHSTAPNRRFPDLITHRLLKAALAGQPAPYSNGELGEFARHCTEQEDAATKVERQVRKSAAALLSGIADRRSVRRYRDRRVRQGDLGPNRSASSGRKGRARIQRS